MRVPHVSLLRRGIACTGPLFNLQFSVLSCQFSVLSGQSPIVSCQLPVDLCHPDRRDRRERSGGTCISQFSRKPVAPRLASERWHRLHQTLTTEN